MPEGPRKRVTALRYEGTGSPKVVATGTGIIAERILAEARRAGVPVREDAALAAALGALQLGEHVPEPLFRAVAEALAWAYRVDARADGPPPP